jgi:hypothetical protein
VRCLLLALAVASVACEPSTPSETSASATTATPPTATPPTAKTVDVTTLQHGVADAPTAWLDGLRLYVDGYVGTVEAPKEGATKRTLWLRATPKGEDVVSCDLADALPQTGSSVRLSGVPRPLPDNRVRLVMCRFDR